MRGDPSLARIRTLFSGAAPRYDVVVRTTTLGMDVLWKRRLLATIPPDRSFDRIVDLACGTGIVTEALATRYPDADVIGVDLSEDMLAIAWRRLTQENVELVRMRAEDLHALRSASVDLVVGSYLPKYVDLDELARSVTAVLDELGVVVFHDFTYPHHPIYRFGFDVYWAALARLLDRLPGYGPIAADLKPLIVENTDWPDRLLGALETAGFDRTTHRVQPLQIAAIVTATKAGRG